MPRAWLLLIFLVTAVLCASPHSARAQFDDASRARQAPRSRAVFDNRAPFVAEQVVPAETKKPITRPEASAKSGDSATDAKAKPASPAASLWTSFGSLAIVVIVILLIARTWKKHGPRIGGGIPPEAVEVLGKRAIDQRQTLHLVRLGSKILLIGSSPTGMRTLSEVTDPIDVDYLAGLCKQNDADPTAAQTFRALFNRNLPPERSQRRRRRATQSPTGEREQNDLRESFPQPDLEEAHD